MKRFIPYIVIFVLTLILTIAVVPSVIRQQNIFPADEGGDTNQLVITVHDEANPRSYGKEMRIKSISVNGKLMDLGTISNDSWVWHPEWDYVLYQNGDGSLVINIDERIQNLVVTCIEQEGSGKCTITLNGKAEKTFDMYSRKWRETTYSVRYFDWAYYIYFLSSVGIAILALFLLAYKILLYAVDRTPVIPLKVGIGAFDLAKGLGILGVMLGHSAEQVAANSTYFSYSTIITVLAITFIYALIPMFYIVSGYGSRARNSRLLIRKQLRLFVEIYGVYTLCMLVIGFIKCLLVPGYTGDDYFTQMLSILLMMQHNQDLFGLGLWPAGPLWFLVSLCVGRIIFNEILKIKSFKMQTFVVVLFLIPIYLVSKFDVAVFCIGAIFSAVFFLFVGYCLGRYKVFSSDKKSVRIAFLIGIILFYTLAVFNGVSFSIAGNSWGRYFFVGIVVSVLGGTIVTWGSLILGKTINYPLRLIKDIGKKSAFYLFAHSIECMTIPWNELTERLKWGFQPKALFVFFCRFFITLVLAQIITTAFSIWKKKKCK